MRNIVDLIRQGRCTLLSALQQQQARKSHLGRDRIRAYLGARLADHDARVAHLRVRAHISPISPLYLAYISLHLRVRPLGHNPYPYPYLYLYP